MFNNNFNRPNTNRPGGPIAGMPKPGGPAGLPNRPKNIGGITKPMAKTNPFANVHTDKTGSAKQIMNSQGQNLIHNDQRGIKP